MKHYKKMTEKEYIEDLKRINCELRESEQKYKNLIKLSGEGIWIIDKDAFTTFVNKGLCDMFGYNEDEMMGKHLFYFMDDQGRELAQMNLERIKKGITERHEFEFIKKDGKKIYVNLFTSPVPDEEGNYEGAFTFLADITERIEIEKKLAFRLSLERCMSDISRKFINITPDKVDEEIKNSLELIGKFLFADRAYIILFSDKEKIIKKAYEWCGEGIEPYIYKLENYSMESYKWVMNKFYSSEPVYISKMSDIPPEGSYERKALEEKGVKSLLAIPLLIEGKVSGFIGFSSIKKERDWNKEYMVLLNISGEIFMNALEKRKIEKELRENQEILKYYSENLENTVIERTKQLFDTQEKLIRQEKLAVMGQLAGGVGHELRNPLGVISNAVYFLRMVSSEGNPVFKEYLDIISSEVVKSDKIISDLLEFSRIKSVNKVNTNIFSIISEVLSKNPVPEKIRVINDIYPSLPSVYADPLHMEQIFRNIIINASQSIKDGGEVILSSISDGDYVYISVKDTGCGIPAENMKKIFDPLFTTKTRGLGLGLSVTKKLAEANGGNIDVESKEGEGTIFTVSIPVKRDAWCAGARLPRPALEW
jgi:PAS domain S-box-containing protein